MKFTVLSHASLLVESNNGKKLLCDPWLIGSSYWRSWWNYPPVKRELIENLIPDVVYITHIHWDHFHGPSLEKFPKDTKIIVPKGNYDRNKKDLINLGFNNVHELKHGESYKIDDDFEITSYQFGVFLDSAVLISCDNARLLNLNDSKHMGPTLNQIVKNHNPIDFIFRSHSSANSRMSYQFIDEDNTHSDDNEKYIEDFFCTAMATGAKYAIPFASNHCHLHKDSWHYNNFVQTPLAVKDYFSQKETNIELKIMVSGDSWDTNKGFEIENHDFFTNREQRLSEYRAKNQEKLDAFYKQEDNTKINKKLVERYYKDLSKRIPYFVKKKIKNTFFTYVLHTHARPAYIFNINISEGKVNLIDKETDLDFDNYPIQIHTTAFIFLRCIGFKIFSHMSIGKRVFYKLKKKDEGKMQMVNLIYNLEEYDMLPISRIFSKRSIETWTLRWREIFLYFMLVKDKLIHKKIDFKKYLKPHANEK